MADTEHTLQEIVFFRRFNEIIKDFYTRNMYNIKSFR